jgi:histidyl-tRNA synthetase
VAVDLDYMDRSPKGQMKQAGRSGAVYAAIIGEEELAQRVVKLRDMRSGEEKTVPQAEAVTLIEEAKDPS